MRRPVVNFEPCNFHPPQQTFMKYQFLYFSAILSVSFALLACGASSVHHEEEEDHHHDSGIVLEPDKAREFGIITEVVAPGNFHDVISASGTIEASSSDIYTVSAKKSGILTLSPGVTEGVSLKTGQTIASISPKGLQGGDASQVAAANLKAAKAEYERLKSLFDDGLVTASVFREAERSYNESKAIANEGLSSAASTAASPVDGTIINLNAGSGEYVETGAPIATIAKNSTQILKVDLPLRHAKHLPEIETANFIPEGSSEAFKLSELNGKKISGNSSVSASNGYLPVFFSFSGNSLSYPGGVAKVFLICNGRQGVISVPLDALIEIQGNNYVYVKSGDHSYEKRLVKTGASDGERLEILEGLSPGDIIVSKGASIVRMAEVSSIAPPSHSHSH